MRSLKGNKTYTELNKNKNTTYQNLWNAKNSADRGIYSTRCLHQKRVKFSKKLLKFQPQETRKKEQNIPKVIRRKKLIKARVEISDIEIRETKINETKIWLFGKRSTKTINLQSKKK